MGFGSDLLNGLVSSATGGQITDVSKTKTNEVLQPGSDALNHMKASSEMRSYLSEDLFQDPLWLRFKVFFNFTSSEGLLADKSIAGTNSAYKYFERIGDTAKCNLLTQFISDLKTISTEYSFLFEEVTGLSEILGAPMGEFLKEDQKIDIRFKETLDMKIQGLIENYRKLVWDWDRRVYVLPKNLRRFGMHLYIYPMGVYHVKAEDVKASGAGEGSRNISNLFPCYVIGAEQSSYILAAPSAHNHVLYRFNGCEILLNNSGANFISSIINWNPEPTTNLLSIHPMSHEIEGTITNWWHTGSANMKAFASLVEKASDKNGLDALKEQLKGQALDLAKDTILDIASPITDRAGAIVNSLGIDFSKGAVENLANIGANIAMDAANYIASNGSAFVKNKINRLFYGNVYGFSADTILSGIGSVNGMMTTMRNSLGNNRNQGSGNSSKVGTNVYEGDNPADKPPMYEDNIYNSGTRYRQL